MDQVLSQEGDSHRATQEFFYHVGLDGATGLSEADGVLLMELMEDSPALAVDDDIDRLSHVIRSLEAEIMRGGAATVPRDDCLSTGPPTQSEDSCMIDEMLMAGLDGYGEAAPMGYWPEVPPVGGWYLYTDGGEGSTIVGYEVREEQYYYGADQGGVEQVYSPLWE